MKNKTKYLCLNCKYEPDWSDPTEHPEYPKRIGQCKCKPNWPPIPWVYLIQKKTLVRYSDDSGLPTRCEAWEPKE